MLSHGQDLSKNCDSRKFQADRQRVTCANVSWGCALRDAMISPALLPRVRSFTNRRLLGHLDCLGVGFDFIEHRTKLTLLFVLQLPRLVAALSCHFCVLFLKSGFSSHRAGPVWRAKVSSHQSPFSITSRLTASDSVR